MTKAKCGNIPCSDVGFVLTLHFGDFFQCGLKLLKIFEKFYISVFTIKGFSPPTMWILPLLAQFHLHLNCAKWRNLRHRILSGRAAGRQHFCSETFVRTDTEHGEHLSIFVRRCCPRASQKVSWKATVVGNFHVARWKSQSRFLLSNCKLIAK